jgi:cellobiose-specific phosphotransferase system component IIB
MKRTVISAGVVFIMVIGFVCFRSCQHPSTASYFNKDNEGWKVMGDAQGESVVPDHFDKDGNPGGYISASDDITGEVWYWSAPEKFLGNKSWAYGKILSFSLKQSSTDNQFDDSDVMLVGADMKIVFNTSRNPEKAWTDYSVPISEASGWTYDNIHGDPVSRKDLKLILRDLTAIYIRGEYVTGEDTGGLDTVILHSSGSEGKS